MLRTARVVLRSVPGSARRAHAAAAPATRPCCGSDSRCYKVHHLRELNRASHGASRVLLAELSACCKGLDREDMIDVVCRTAGRGYKRLSQQALHEMERQHMRASLTAHNAVLDVLAGEGQWAECLQVLLRMHQHALHPDEASYAAVIRSAVGTPGSDHLARTLLPEMLRIQPSENPVPSSRAAPHRRSLLLARLGADSAGAVEFLEQRLSGGQLVDASMFRAALWGCAKNHKGGWREALRLVRMMEAWLLRSDEPLEGRVAVDVQKAFAAAVTACDQGGQREEALAVLGRMESCGVAPEREAYNAAMLACRHGGDVEEMRATGERMMRRGISPDRRSYNAVLAVLAARGGMGEEALEVLASLHARKLEPDYISYSTTLLACRPTAAEAAARSAAARSAAPEVAAPVAAEEDGVAAAGWRLAAEAEAEAPWRRALQLLPEMRLRGLPPDARTYRAALELCASCGLAAEAEDLLEAIAADVAGDDRLEADTAAVDNGRYLAIAAKACARAADAAAARRVLRAAERGGARRASAESQESTMRLYSYAIGAHSAAGAPLALSLALLLRLRRWHGQQPSPLVYRAALQACAQRRGAGQARRLLRQMQAEGGQPCEASLMLAMRACAEGEGWRASVALLREARGDDAAAPTLGALHTLRAAVAEGAGWVAVTALLPHLLPHLLPGQRDGGGGAEAEVRAEAAEAATAGEASAAELLPVELLPALLCAAAQEGTRPAELARVRRRLAREGQQVGAKLLEEALRSLSNASAELEGWRNVPALLRMAAEAHQAGEGNALAPRVLLLALAAAPPAAAPPGRDDPSGPRRARGEQTVRAIAELCGVQIKGGMLTEAVRAYVAHPACEELAERALQEVRAGVGASGDARELAAATGGERTLRAAAEVHL